MLEALCVIRGAARVSAQMQTRHGRSAAKVIDRKIQSLLRKKAWRESNGQIPVHMADPKFAYVIPDDPLTGALRELLAAEAAFVSEIQEMRSPRLRAAVEMGNAALVGLEPTLPALREKE